MSSSLSSSYYFTIIGTKDNPLYELEFSSFKSTNLASTDNHIPGKSQFTPSTKELLPFIANSSLDLIEDQTYSNSILNLGKIDQFYELSINAYILQSQVKFILCYSCKEETSIKQFFQEVNELYVKCLMNPFYNVNDAIVSPDFDLKIKQLARKYL
ncbi:Trafficking protein particle complex subunit 20 [Candida viswanathii]|uniref:Trafficking protein particle complex subunit 20 n=1 Tax=Candida viswanathii TaxID=5486 RepID=A0A367XSC3_9ASCO|nr:Trafficking protein particle complex subunit 20 [Candida viswanathii]